MATFDPMGEFDGLLPDFARLYLQAQEPREEPPGEPFIRIARAGFLRHEQPDRWGPEQEALIRAYRTGDYSDTSLRRYEEDAVLLASFACLALGALLGLYSRGEVNDRDYLHGEALLPGFLLLYDQNISGSV